MLVLLSGNPRNKVLKDEVGSSTNLVIPSPKEEVRRSSNYLNSFREILEIRR